MKDQSPEDVDLAARYGAFAGFRTEAAPIEVTYSSGNPAKDLARLLDQHVHARCRFIDIGCGAETTLCRLAPHVQEAWGFEQARVLPAATRRQVSRLGLSNVTCVEGNAAEPADVAHLPDDHFDLAVSQRSPNLNASLARTLRKDATFIQEFVSEFDMNPLGEALGRNARTSYSLVGHEWLLRQYADMGLFPIGTREYFYEEYFRDSDHLAALLGQGPFRWPQPDDAVQDKRVLEIYANEHATSFGVRVLRHRRLFVPRRRWPYYPPLSA